MKSTEVMFRWAFYRLQKLSDSDKDRNALYEEFRELIQSFYGYNKINHILYLDYLNEND